MVEQLTGEASRHPNVPDGIDMKSSACLTGQVVLDRMGSRSGGLTDAEVQARRAAFGPNALRVHQVRWTSVLLSQLRSPLLLLLFVTAGVSFAVGERADAVIIGTILAVSIGLSFVNEYRAALAAEALRSRIRHEVIVRRNGKNVACDAMELVPGDIVHLSVGTIVPADVRILRSNGLELDESVLTGESLPVEKQTDPLPAPTSSIADVTCGAYMGTVVRDGEGDAVVVTTGGRTEFGHIAAGLASREGETEFQKGLRNFSLFLVRVALVLTSAIFVVNVLLHHSVLDALLFSLAIAVGITPQLLPAVVTTSLAAGSRRLAQRHVLIKRLVVIEDLGNIEVLLTDKTGTLTEGKISFEHAIDTNGKPDDHLIELGLLANEATIEDGKAISGNQLDVALWDAAPDPRNAVPGWKRIATIPFDHERRMMSVLVASPDGGRTLITKGAPESVLAACTSVPPGAKQTLDTEFRSGSRVVAIATRADLHDDHVTADDEHGLTLAGFLVFLDRPKTDAAASLRRLAQLGITTKIVTGDNAIVAQKVCSDLGLEASRVLTGDEVDALNDDALREQVAGITVFARVSPDQKSRIIRAHRVSGHDVAFMGDGVNDAVALHVADVGISVESATDVAKDAADIVLLEKDLGVLADGVSEGRRTFANTIKYVLMGTSSNFGNMFSAAAASTFLTFLPMLPSQILLNNLLYDTSQMAIPTDDADAELVARPAHWDLRFIRRFMLLFGPISSLFDFATFGLMLGVFHAHEHLFQSGWFVESLATQTLVVFVIRTRRIPFWTSRPSRPLLVAAITVVAVGAYLPYSPFSHTLGFEPLPFTFFLALTGMVVLYLFLVEVAKRAFYRRSEVQPHPVRTPAAKKHHRVLRRASRWTRPVVLHHQSAAS